MKQELPSWVRPLRGAPERRSPQSAEWRGQPNLLEAGGTPQPGPCRPRGGARLPARTGMPLGSMGEGEPLTQAAPQAMARAQQVETPSTVSPPAAPLPCRASPEASCVPSGRACSSSGPAVQSGPSSPHSDRTSHSAEEGLPRKGLPELSWAERGVGQPGRLPTADGGSVGCPEGHGAPRTSRPARKAAGFHRPLLNVDALAPLTSRPPKQLRSSRGWGGRQRAGQRAWARGDMEDGPRQVAGVRAMHKAQTDAVEGSGKLPAVPPGRTRQRPPHTGRLDTEQPRPRVRKSSVAVDVCPADFQRPQAPPSGFPTSRDPHRYPLAHFGCEGKSSVLGWGVLRCPPPRH